MDLNQLLIGQIVFLCLIISGLFFVFKKKLRPFKIDELIIAAQFIIIPIIFSAYLSFYIPLAGVNAFKIGFAQPIMAVGGIILSTPIGYIAGIIVDILGIILVPSGLMYFGFTFNAVMVYMIGNLVFKYTKNIDEYYLKKYIYIGLVILSLLFTILIIFLTKTIKLESLVIDLNQTTFLISNRLLLILMIWILMLLLVGVIKYVVSLLKNEVQINVYRFILVILCMELIVNVLLTSLHIHIMYGIPYLALVVPRIVKAIILLPINVMIGYFVLKIIKKIKE